MPANLSVVQFAPSANPAPAGGGGLAVISVLWQISDLSGWLDYVVSPEAPLTQTNGTTVALASTQVGFADTDIVVTYNARTFTIPTPSTPAWYYVTVYDPGMTGDVSGSPTLTAYCDNNNARVGQAGYAYMGAILCTATGAASIPLPGGWPNQTKTLFG